MGREAGRSLVVGGVVGVVLVLGGREERAAGQRARASGGGSQI